MANKTRKYDVRCTWKDDGNRATPLLIRVAATTVQRAISKTVKDINAGLAKGPDGLPVEPDFPETIGDDDEARASDFMFVDVRSADFND